MFSLGLFVFYKFCSKYEGLGIKFQMCRRSSRGQEMLQWFNSKRKEVALLTKSSSKSKRRQSAKHMAWLTGDLWGGAVLKLCGKMLIRMSTWDRGSALGNCDSRGDGKMWPLLAQTHQPSQSIYIPQCGHIKKTVLTKLVCFDLFTMKYIALRLTRHFWWNLFFLAYAQNNKSVINMSVYRRWSVLKCMFLPIRHT